jgi:hypothetical protein
VLTSYAAPTATVLGGKDALSQIEVVDEIKEALSCPGVVSYADIVAMATLDPVVLVRAACLLSLPISRFASLCACCFSLCALPPSPFPVQTPEFSDSTPSAAWRFHCSVYPALAVPPSPPPPRSFDLVLLLADPA